jgi:putative ABC transport system permease protein
VSPALLHNCLMAALRNLGASPVQSAIAIGSLAIGLWAAILAGVIADNQAGYDRFIPDSRQIYMATLQSSGFMGTRSHSTAIPPDIAERLRVLAEVREVTRFNRNRGVFTRGGINLRENYYWADPNFFRMLKLPALHGDPAAALERPDGMVLTRAMARKYFGSDDPRGQSLLINHKYPATVRAVIADLPVHGSNLEFGAFISSRAPLLAISDAANRTGIGGANMFPDATTLVRLADGAGTAALDDAATRLLRNGRYGLRIYPEASIRFLRLDAVALSPLLHPANRERLAIFTAMALLILLLACLNFVSLSLARSGRRAAEVGIRKAAGAGRGALVAQFLGEAVVQALLGLCLAMMLVEWSLPLVNGFLQSGAVFAWWREPALLAALLGGTVSVGVLAGLYPAFVLSAFPPALVLKGLMLRSSPLGARMRQAMVTLQFAIPLVLVIAAALVFLQNRFAVTQALSLDTDRMLMINLPVCDAGLTNEIAALPGVAGAACSGPSLMPDLMLSSPVHLRNGRQVNMMLGTVGFQFFQLYRLAPLAGRLPDPAHPGDVAQRPEPGKAPAPVHYVINETAATALGYAAPADAIGKTMDFGRVSTANGIVIGVVRDFSLYPPLMKFSPTVYRVSIMPGRGMGGPDLDAAALHVRLAGRDMPATLAAIDTVWKRHSQDPINRILLDDYVRQRQIDVLRQGQAFALFAGVAALLACLGLFGLSLSVAERRIKEIGVRKAMGAGDGQIVALLLWQFSRPVLLANLIAWPAAWWLMRRWLSEFPYHIDLHWWVFAAGSAAMVAIALVTVAGQALTAARARPVLALRYE